MTPTKKERLLQLADVLETDRVAKHFDMGHYVRFNPGPTAFEPKRITTVLHECGAVACIAGWTVATFDPTRIVYDRDHLKPIAAELLRLDVIEADELFTPDVRMVPGRHAMDATATEAAKVVRHFAETGEIDWRVACPTS